MKLRSNEILNVNYLKFTISVCSEEYNHISIEHPSLSTVFVRKFDVGQRSLIHWTFFLHGSWRYRIIKQNVPNKRIDISSGLSSAAAAKIGLIWKAKRK